MLHPVDCGAGDSSVFDYTRKPISLHNGDQLAFNYVKLPIIEACKCGMMYVHHFEYAQYRCVRCGEAMRVFDMNVELKK